VVFGDAALAAMLAMASALAAWEFYRIAQAGNTYPMSAAGIALAGMVPLAVHAQYLGLWKPSYALGAVILVAVFAASIWTRGVSNRPLSSVAVTLLGVGYTGCMLAFGYAIRYHPYAFADASLAGLTIPSGALLLLLPLFVVWASDIGAYAVGRMLGRHKLIPAVSPGKTVEGAIGGLLASALVAWIYVDAVLAPAAQLGFRWRLTGVIVFAIIVSAAAQLGDLAESLLKREAGVKDSSHLIPGHGGVLDRLDSLFFALPVSYFLLGMLLTWAAPQG
jgi:phosphatidate cytidylyltransferase